MLAWPAHPTPEQAKAWPASRPSFDLGAAAVSSVFFMTATQRRLAVQPRSVDHIAHLSLQYAAAMQHGASMPGRPQHLLAGNVALRQQMRPRVQCRASWQEVCPDLKPVL